MKYPTTTNGTDNTLRYYGHITPTRDNSTCVTRTKVDDGHEVRLYFSFIQFVRLKLILISC